MNDLISRQAAIDAVEESRRLNHHHDGKEACAHEYEHRHFLKILRDLPSAQPKQRWIPCSKRLPPELKPVNVTWINGQPPTYYEKLKDKPFTDTAVYYEGEWYWQSATCVDLLKEYGESPADYVAYGIEIIAWMPLPEPYGGEKE